MRATARALTRRSLRRRGCRRTWSFLMPAQCVRPVWVVLEMVVATRMLLFLLRTASAVASEIVSCAVAVAANATDGTSQVMAMPALLLSSHSTCNCNTPQLFYHQAVLLCHCTGP